MKRYYGKGPVEARSYFVDDLLFVVMRGVVTTAEGTMIEAGQEDAVRGFRQRFENEMAPRLKRTIERLTGRNVVNYQSQIMFDPDMLIEIFVFDQPMSGDARHEAASVPAGPAGGIDHEVGGEPDEVGGEPDEVGGEPDEVGGEPDEVGGEPDEVGGEPDEVGGDTDGDGGGGPSEART